MGNVVFKRMSKSNKYKHVYCIPGPPGENRNKIWCARLKAPNGRISSKFFDTEREAAIAADVKLIELGKQPVNVLKRK